MQGAGVSWSPGSDQAERTQLRAKWVSVSSSAALLGPQPPGNEECGHQDIHCSRSRTGTSFRHEYSPHSTQQLIQPELLLTFQHRLRISEIISEPNICAQHRSSFSVVLMQCSGSVCHGGIIRLIQISTSAMWRIGAEWRIYSVAPHPPTQYTMRRFLRC